MLRTSRSCKAIGRKLGRSAHAVYRRSARLGVWPTKQDWVTSSVAAEIAGVSQQWLTSLARRGRVRARRVPGGKWWLFDLEALGGRLPAAMTGRRSTSGGEE